MKRLIVPIIITLISSLSLWASDGELPETESPTAFKIQYMGNVEAGHIFVWDNFMKNTSGIVTLTTTHGVRLTPYLFTGIGVGAWLTYYSGGFSMFIPIFADVRATLPLKGNLRPFVDLKGGRINSYNNFVGPSIGCKYAWGKKAGVYLSFGTNYIINNNKSQWDGFNVRLGFDF